MSFGCVCDRGEDDGGCVLIVGCAGVVMQGNWCVVWLGWSSVCGSRDCLVV